MFYVYFFFFNDTATTEIYTLSLHDALPIYRDDLRHEGQGRFLDLRRRLEQRDEEAHQQGGQQHGGGDLGGDQHRLDGDLGDVGVAHCSTPYSFRSSVAGAPCDARSHVVFASLISRSSLPAPS